MQITVARRIGGLVLAGVASAMIIGGAAFILVGSMRVQTERSAQLAEARAQLGIMSRHLAEMGSLQRSALLARTPTERAAVEDQFQGAASDLRQVGSALSRLELGADVADRLVPLQAEVDSYATESARALPSLLAGDPASAGTTDLVRALADRETAVQKLDDSVSRSIADIEAAAVTAIERTGREVQLTVGVVTVVTTLLLAGVGWAVARSIVRPIRVMVGALQRVAEKDLTVELDIRGEDEIGEMGRALTTAVGSMRETVATLADSSSTLAAASEELSAVSTQLSQNAFRTAEGAHQVTGATADMSGSISAMSAATEELSASISEIASQATSATLIASDGVRAAEATSLSVAELDHAGTEIGEIVKTITSIAEQTNLLALNATIEAARAGDAGKGFAVVASEVKDLAGQTARATEDVTTKIASIQATTSRATQALSQISIIISAIHEKQTTIAGAVEEQSAVTQEISRTVSDVSDGAGKVDESMSQIAGSADQTNAGAASARHSATDLATLSAKVQLLVGGFTY